jgi:hypothetical protein
MENETTQDTECAVDYAGAECPNRGEIEQIF